jgi:hypothetical protein
MNQDTKTVYTLCHAKDTRNISEHFVDQKEDIYDLAVAAYWGTLVDVPDGRLEIVVDMTQMEVSIRDRRSNITIRYNILAFDRRE